MTKCKCAGCKDKYRCEDCGCSVIWDESSHKFYHFTGHNLNCYCKHAEAQHKAECKHEHRFHETVINEEARIRCVDCKQYDFTIGDVEEQAVKKALRQFADDVEKYIDEECRDIKKCKKNKDLTENGMGQYLALQGVIQKLKALKKEAGL